MKPVRFACERTASLALANKYSTAAGPQRRLLSGGTPRTKERTAAIPQLSARWLATSARPQRQVPCGLTEEAGGVSTRVEPLLRYQLQGPFSVCRSHLILEFTRRLIAQFARNLRVELRADQPLGGNESPLRRHHSLHDAAGVAWRLAVETPP